MKPAGPWVLQARLPLVWAVFTSGHQRAPGWSETDLAGTAGVPELRPMGPLLQQTGPRMSPWQTREREQASPRVQAFQVCTCVPFTNVSPSPSRSRGRRREGAGGCSSLG